MLLRTQSAQPSPPSYSSRMYKRAQPSMDVTAYRASSEARGRCLPTSQCCTVDTSAAASASTHSCSSYLLVSSSSTSPRQYLLGAWNEQSRSNSRGPFAAHNRRPTLYRLYVHLPHCTYSGTRGLSFDCVVNCPALRCHWWLIIVHILIPFASACNDDCDI